MIKLLKGMLVIVCSFMFFVIFLNYERDLIQIVNENIMVKQDYESITYNTYRRDIDFKFVKNSSDLIVKNKEDIYNAFYSGINNGNSTFNFYCKHGYDECSYDVKEIASNRSLLSHINNFTHPFNSFKQIETKFDSFGKVSVTLRKNYTDSEIERINTKIDEVYNELYYPEDSTRNNLLRFHDYIISNTKYDYNRVNKKDYTYHSDKAIGPLFEGYAICSGYTDLMQLFIEKMGLANYRVASDSHTWNAVNIDNKWYHVDLTWDDPVAVDMPDFDVLDDTFFLITTDELLRYNTGQHNFDDEIYQELQLEY